MGALAMTKRAFVWALGVMFAVGGGGVAFGGANEKLALVTVVADEFNPAAGLTPADFSIMEDKDAVEVVEAVPARDPLSIVLVVDTSMPSSGVAPTPELRRALTSFVATVQGGEPTAQIALYQVAHAATPVTDFTSSRPALDKAIGLIASGTAPGGAMLEGVATAATRIGAMPAPRRAIVCVGIGTAEDSGYVPKDVGDRVRKSGATLWVVSVGQPTDAPLTSRDVVWTRVTADTGGLRQNTVQAMRLDGPLKTVANSLLSQYTLKMVRKKDGAVKGLKGQTTKGSQILFTHWMR
jgi:hypothetical protein